MAKNQKNGGGVAWPAIVLPVVAAGAAAAWMLLKDDEPARGRGRAGSNGSAGNGLIEKVEKKVADVFGGAPAAKPRRKTGARKGRKAGAKARSSKRATGGGNVTGRTGKGRGKRGGARRTRVTPITASND